MSDKSLAMHYFNKGGGAPQWFSVNVDDGADEWQEIVTPSAGKKIVLIFLFPFIKSLTASEDDISVAIYDSGASDSEISASGSGLGTGDDKYIIDNYVAQNATLGFPMDLSACPIELAAGKSLYAKSGSAAGITSPRVCGAYYEVDE